MEECKLCSACNVCNHLGIPKVIINPYCKTCIFFDYCGIRNSYVYISCEMKFSKLKDYRCLKYKDASKYYKEYEDAEV